MFSHVRHASCRCFHCPFVHQLCIELFAFSRRNSNRLGDFSHAADPLRTVEKGKLKTKYREPEGGRTIDEGENRIKKELLTFFVEVLPINQPKLCPNASWNANANTFANISFYSDYANSITINHQNTLAAADYYYNRIRIWLQYYWQLVQNHQHYPISSHRSLSDQ